MPANAGWLIDQRSPLSHADLDLLDRELADAGPASRAATATRPTIAVSIHDVVIHDTRKWFGEADIRLDALVVTGYAEPNSPTSSYMPKTATFPRIKDGDRLQIGSGGLLAFYGPASHFLDISIMVSSDRKGTDDLATLLTGKMQSPEAQGALGTLMGLAVAVPQVAMVKAAMDAAGILGELAFRLLRNVTGNAIGLYRTCHTSVRDGLGVGTHPGAPPESFRVNDLSFRYEISVEE